MNNIKINSAINKMGQRTNIIQRRRTVLSYIRSLSSLATSIPMSSTDN